MARIQLRATEWIKSDVYYYNLKIMVANETKLFYCCFKVVKRECYQFAIPGLFNVIKYI